MFRDLIFKSLIVTMIFILLTGLVFPATIWVVGRTIFPHQANGSFIVSGGKTVGSELIGQNFEQDQYFHPRPSAAGGAYDGSNSGGTNLGPNSLKLIEGTNNSSNASGSGEFLGVRQLARKYRSENMLSEGTLVPVDAVTRSASGLDPHISVKNAYMQSNRVALVRGVNPAEVKLLVSRMIEERFLGIFGEPRINVLKLNLELDSRFSKKQ